MFEEDDIQIVLISDWKNKINKLINEIRLRLQPKQLP